ncbi:hypothetical protein Tsubulata_046030, partial [Turnera subulata]
DEKMVAAVSTAINPKPTQKRPPLLPSEPDNGFPNTSRRPKQREVSSRYMSSSTSSSASTASTPSKTSSKRCPSPLISRPTAGMTPAHSSTIKRAQSVERRRPSTPRPLDLGPGNNGNGHNANGVGRGGAAGELSNAQKMLITSTRSLSVSKAKPAPTPASSRKGTPERRKAVTPARGGADQVENSRPWPGRMRQQNPNSMSRSVDFTDDRKRVTGSGLNGSVVRALQSSVMDNRSSIESRLSSDSSIDQGSDAAQCDHLVASDTESVSSASTSESSGNASGGGGQQGRGTRGIIVPARFLQESNNRLRRQSSWEPGSPGSRNVGVKGPGPPSLIAPKRLATDSPVSSPKGVANVRGQLSPIRGGALRPASPSKLGGGASLSPMRGVSPSRVRSSVVGNGNSGSFSSSPSILGFAADIRRVKSGETRILEVHCLRILYNRLLQWRFINARADSSMLAQKSNAECYLSQKSLYNARVTISKLHESVRVKRTELQCLRQNLKLISILRGQMLYLEELALMDQDYSRSLTEATEALKASTLRLPVVCGARADVQNLKDAICSAVDVMQAMASSICLLLSKANPIWGQPSQRCIFHTQVGDVNSLVADLINTTVKERALLDQCKVLLSNIAAMQVEECSLRTHVLQVKRVPSSLMTL